MNMRVLVLVLCAALWVAPSSAQDMRGKIFADVEEAQSTARVAQADFLSPDTFADALREMQRAGRDFDDGKNVDRVRERLVNAKRLFDNATENAGVAALALEEPIKTRTAALEAEAPSLATNLWSDAESDFNAAVKSLERGDLRSARRRGEKAVELFDAAELSAIKARHLSRARVQLAEADRDGIERDVPNTIARARRLLEQADSSLTSDRYATDEPDRLAERAIYETRHARFLAGYAERVRQRKLSVEALLLEWEAPLADIAGAAGVPARFDDGYAAMTEAVIEQVEATQVSEARFRQDVTDANRRMAALEEEIRILDSQLGGASQERRSLVIRLETQARIKEQFVRVESIFGPDEARVLQQSDRVILRLAGLGFPSSSAELGTNAKALLDKVIEAVRIFPGSQVIVEGHTDASGGAQSNLALSQERAESVTTFVAGRAGIPLRQFTTIGYGEARPVANNETAEGRARNRRIDVIIVPPAS
jgi:outer membrane protein OmpA-like peptidoglycan-associated protein